MASTGQTTLGQSPKGVESANAASLLEKPDFHPSHTWGTPRWLRPLPHMTAIEKSRRGPGCANVMPTKPGDLFSGGLQKLASLIYSIHDSYVE